MRVAGISVACEVSCDFNFAADMIPASAIDSGGWKEFLSGLRSWTATVNGRLLVEAVGADFKTIYRSFEDGLPVFLTIGTRPSATTQLTISGNARVASGSLSAPSRGSTTWNISFQGTGKPQTNFQDFRLLIDAMPSDAGYPTIVEEDPQENG